MQNNLILDEPDHIANTTPCEFGRRLLAWLIDTVILTVVILIICIPAFWASDNLDNDQGLQTVVILLVILVAFSGWWLYYAFMESSEAGGTLGKRAMGIRVVDNNGQPIQFGRASGRFFSRLLSRMIPLYIGYLMALGKSGKALHDLIAGTLVVNKR